MRAACGWHEGFGVVVRQDGKDRVLRHWRCLGAGGVETWAVARGMRICIYVA